MKPSLPIAIYFATMLIVACSSSNQTVTHMPSDLSISPVEQIKVEELRNTTYSGIYETPITLNNGMYEGEAYVEGYESRPTVQYMDNSELYGDLDGDGIEDAVVFLLERGGGTANITFIAAQLNRDGHPVDAGSVWLDEVSIKSGVIKDGQVLLEIITRGPGDADCCQSYKTSKTYSLKEGLLVEITGEDQELKKVSVADLNNTSWTMIEMDKEQPALVETEVTISFQDRQITGFGGCNNYTTGFDLSEDNPFVMTIRPIAATKKACPDQILSQETTYFRALENVSQWGNYFGNLSLYYKADQDWPSRLLFSPEKD